MESRGAQHILDEMAAMVSEFSTAPSFADMPRRALADKLAAGPTSAHVIEEVHTPLNVAYLTFTTGSTAFQNIVGITYPELPDRVAAGVAALKRAGASEGDGVLVCYPPLVNVFSRGAFDESGTVPLFLSHSSRDAFLVALCQQRPCIVVGESSFLRTALEDADRLGIAELVPEGMVLLCAGTPLDLDLLPVAESFGAVVHDLYGSQEFGWVAFDGTPLRDDAVLVPVAPGEGEQWASLVLGGLPTGDCFPAQGGHALDPQAAIATHRRRRDERELEIRVRACTAQSVMTVERLCRTILRIKGRVVRLSADLEVGASANVIEVASCWPDCQVLARLSEPSQTRLFGRLVEAQEQYQSQSKTDPVWAKGR